MENLDQLLSKTLHIEGTVVPDDTSIETTPCWDSLTHMELISTLENTYDIELSMDEIVNMRDVKTIKQVVAGKVNE